VSPQAEHTTENHLTHRTSRMPLMQTLVMSKGIMTTKTFPTEHADILARVSWGSEG
jgi:hypothetical protein